MKKRLLIILVCLLGSIGILGLFAACSAEQLAAPQNVRIATNNGNPTLMWSEVENAKTYTVEINGESKQTRRTEMELSRFNLKQGTYTVRVKACAADYADSSWGSTTFQKNASTGLIYQEDVAGEYTVAGIGGASGEIDIPDEYNGLPVTAIGDGAFSGSGVVTSVKIGKNVKTIGTGAFRNCLFLTDMEFAEDGAIENISTGAFQRCVGLASIELPDTITSIGAAAFSYCSNLEKINIPTNLTAIQASAFSGCEKLDKIVIPQNVEFIGENAFLDCIGLTSVKIDSKSVYIGGKAFANCGATIADNNPLTDENKLVVDLGSGVNVIGEYAFQSCSALDAITIPDSVSSIGRGAFGACANLAVVKIGSGVENIGPSAFRGTKLWNEAENYFIIDKWLLERKNADDTNGDLRKLDIVGIAQYAFEAGKLTGAYQLPNSLLYINEGAFSECDMSSVSAGDGVKVIGSYAFRECKYLKTVVLGNNVESIGNGAFANCEQLTAKSSSGNANINIPASVKEIGGNAFYKTALWESSTDILVVDNWVVGCRETAYGALEVPSGTVGIANYAFIDCANVTGVYMPSTVQIIGKGAFYSCRSIERIIIPAGVKVIKSTTFYLCDSLTSITIPTSVEVIEDYAFRACSALTEVRIPDSVTEIGVGAFGFCDYLSDVTIGNSVERIGEWAFEYCVSLSKIELPDSLMDISSYAFYRCSALAEIDFGNGVRTIGDHAFYQCTMLSELDIPDNITSIGDYAFYKCKALWKLKIGDNVRSVGKYAFYECYNLIKVAIPDSVERVDDFAFMNCFGLNAVTLGVNLTALGKHVFMNARQLTVYAEASKAYSTWNGLWNSQFRPVVWGCELSADKSYVVSVTIGESTLANSSAEHGIKAPTKLGGTFAGWSTTKDGEKEIAAEDIVKVEIGAKLYAVWDNVEEKPNIRVTPDYAPGWDKKTTLPGGLEVITP
ncbi:MAG: leucine-rich repeat protein [Clostridiales bacterium]|nr:leucine-rich repeat protein [Clostridiales bacterium]